MALEVLIVDDSTFFQRQLSDIINENPKLHVAGVACNGQDAIDKVKKLKPDLVTMDYEMPGMDGVSAVRSIMSENPLPILMLSSMTYAGAKITIDALDAGAAEFMTKNFAEISAKGSVIKRRLYDTLINLGQSKRSENSPSKNNPSSTAPNLKSKPAARHAHTHNSLEDNVTSDGQLNSNRSTKDLFESSSKPKIVAIGSSTGGPAALTQMLTTIPKNFPLPILIVQHMPENFTLAFSERLDRQCQIAVKEAEDGDELLAGRALLAPGGKQLIVDEKNKKRVRVIDSKNSVSYKPSVDVTFASLSNYYAQHTLAIILTGMGSDGCDGARLLKAKKATVWTQSEESCVIYGMPMAVDKAGLSNASLNLTKISQHLTAIS